MEKRVASVLIVLMVVSILMVFANARGITGYGIFDEGGIIFLQSSAEIMTPHVEYLDYILDDGSQFLPIIIKDPNTLQDSISATIDGNGQSYPITLNKLQNDPGHFGSDLFYFEGDPGVVLTPGITYVINYGSNSRSIKVSDDGLLNDINTRIDWFTHTERESPNAVFNWIPHTGTFQTSTGLTQNVFRDFERGGHPDGTDFRLYVWAAPEVGAGLGNAKKDLENTDYLSIEPARYAEFGEIAKGYRNLLRDAVIPEQSDEGNITSIINTNSLSLHGLNDEVPIDGLAGFRKKGGTIAGAMHFAMSIENDDPSTATELYEKAKALYRYNSWGASNWPNSGSNPENTLGQEYKISQLRGSAAMALSGQDYPTGMSGSYINDAIARLSELKQLLRTGNGNDVTCMKANWLANTRCTHQRYNVFDQALIDLYDYAVQNGQTNAAWFVNDLEPLILQNWESVKRFQPGGNMENVFGLYPQAVYPSGVGAPSGTFLVSESNDKIAYFGLESIASPDIVEQTNNHLMVPMMNFYARIAENFPSEEEEMIKTALKMHYFREGMNSLDMRAIDGDIQGGFVEEGNGQIAHYGNFWPNSVDRAEPNGFEGISNGVFTSSCSTNYFCTEQHLELTHVALEGVVALHTIWLDQQNTQCTGAGNCLSAGVCSGVQAECVNGNWICNYPASYGVEVCDGLDNNCDGFVDNGLNAPLCNNQLGVCEGSVKACGGVSGWLECDYSGISVYEVSELTCYDELDNDCDDDGLTEGAGTDCEDNSCTQSVSCPGGRPTNFMAVVN